MILSSRSPGVESREPRSNSAFMGLIVRSSSIHAAGVFTTAPIKNGTLIIEYTGQRLPKAVADELYAEKVFTYLFGLDDGEIVIDGHGMAAFINHSCDPNCEAEEDDRGRVWIRALDDIAPGQELTYDYCLYDGEGEEPCFCGAKKCRGTMYSRAEVRKKESGFRRQKSEEKSRCATRL